MRGCFPVRRPALGSQAVEGFGGLGRVSQMSAITQNTPLPEEKPLLRWHGPCAWLGGMSNIPELSQQ